MASEVLIAFKTRGLEQAKKLAEDIARKVKEAAKTIKDVSVRKKFQAAQKKIAGERAEEIAEQERDIDLLRRGGKLKGRELRGANVRGVANQGKEAFEKLRTLGAVASSGNLAGALTLLGSVPVAGQVAAAAAAAVALVLPILEKREQVFQARRDERTKQIVAEVLRTTDFSRRLAEDVEFRAAQEKRAGELFLRTERARAVGGWHPRSGGLIEVG